MEEQSEVRWRQPRSALCGLALRRVALGSGTEAREAWGGGARIGRSVVGLGEALLTAWRHEHSVCPRVHSEGDGQWLTKAIAKELSERFATLSHDEREAYEIMGATAKDEWLSGNTPWPNASGVTIAP